TSRSPSKRPSTSPAASGKSCANSNMKRATTRPNRKAFSQRLVLSGRASVHKFGVTAFLVAAMVPAAMEGKHAQGLLDRPRHGYRSRSVQALCRGSAGGIQEIWRHCLGAGRAL